MRKARAVRGFTLIEMIVVVAIIGVLATMVVIRYSGKTDQAKAATARSQVAQIEGAVISFQADIGRLPASLDELVNPPSSGDTTRWQEGGYLKGSTVPKDPWGNPYLYRASGRRFEIISFGADGVEGGAGVDADISNESGEK